jgi:3-oxoacyl-[acyl-carrier-protein] synthase I
LNQLNKLYISATGMITPVGVNTEMTAASVKAGVNRYQASHIINKKFEPMTLALVPDEALPELAKPLKEIGLSERKRRMLRLCDAASSDFAKLIPTDLNIPLFLALPEPIIHSRSTFDKSFISHIMEQTGLIFSVEHSRIFSMGRAGGAHAIEYAFRYMEANNSDVSIVAGVDSYLDIHLLRKLDSEDRVKSSSSMDAFVPGEGAVFLLLVSENLKIKYGKNLSYLSRPGLSEEDGHRYSEKEYLGDGLSSAFRQALMNGPGSPVSSIYSSLNGEAFGAKEYGVASMRNSALISNDCSIEHPSDCFGDLGAACIPTMAALAAVYEERNALIYGSSDGSYRGAVRLGIE